jgi:hypothetical protein
VIALGIGKKTTPALDLAEMRIEPPGWLIGLVGFASYIEKSLRNTGRSVDISNCGILSKVTIEICVILTPGLWTEF